jgi:hypothetical protein
MPIFARYIGVKYSGAEVANASLKAQRIYCAEGDAPPREVAPAPGPGRYWRRKDIAGWLVARLAEDVPTLVGIDLAFSFPLHYFEAHGLAPDWPQFLDDFQRHWPTDSDNTYVDFVREGMCGNGAVDGQVSSTSPRCWKQRIEFDGHHRVDEVDRRVVEGHSP